MNQAQGYSCKCKPGYKGEHCEEGNVLKYLHTYSSTEGFAKEKRLSLPQISTNAMAIPVLMAGNVEMKSDGTFVSALRVMKEQTVKLVSDARVVNHKK